MLIRCASRELCVKEALKRFLIVLLLLEIFLLGSGQFVSFHGISLRMVLYTFALVFFVVSFFSGVKIRIEVIWFSITYALMLLFSSFVGLANGAEIQMVLLNLKGLLYAFIVLPFTLLITTKKSTILVAWLLRFSGFSLAASFLILLTAILTGMLEFSTFYQLASSEANDFMMNPGDIPRIFYKGFLYLGVGFIFFYFSKVPFKGIILLFLLLAIFLTFTRGFLFALVLTFISLLILDLRRQRSILILVSMLLPLAIIFPYYFEFIGDKSISDSLRFLQIQQVFESVTPLSLIVGHGFGIGVPARPDGMEIVFLEVFHKQGVLGLLIWLGFIGYLISKYLKLKSPDRKFVAKPFLASVLYVTFQSLTNPYINNPIGMSIVLLAFVSLLIISDEDRAHANSCRSL